MDGVADGVLFPAWWPGLLADRLAIDAPITIDFDSSIDMLCDQVVHQTQAFAVDPTGDVR